MTARLEGARDRVLRRRRSQAPIAGGAREPASGEDDGLAAGDFDPGAAEYEGLVGGEQHVDRGELGRLPGPPERGVFPNSSTCSGGMVDGISGVQIGPGATEFTRMPRSPSSCAARR